MGRQAASDVAAELRRRLATQDQVRMIFAAAPSQSPMLEALLREPGIDWGRVSAFHMDEYLGLPKTPRNALACGSAGLCLTGFHSLKFISCPGETTRRSRQTGMHKN
jgi:hypothetical protein